MYGEYTRSKLSPQPKLRYILYYIVPHFIFRIPEAIVGDLLGMESLRMGELVGVIVKALTRMLVKKHQCKDLLPGGGLYNNLKYF
jgi:hypothetical protein